MLHCKRNSQICAGRRQNKGGINRFRVASPDPDADFGSTLSGLFRTKRVCDVAGFHNRSPNRSGFRPMPRYFFNTRIGDELISDPEGEELRNPDRAWEVARAMIRELLKTEGTGRGLLNATLEVTDDEGEIVLEFPFAEVILDFSDESITKH